MSDVTESRSDRKREKILSVAAECFIESGYAGVSIDEVVRCAGGSKTNVYTYFGGKDGLFAAVMQRFCEQIVEPLQTVDVEGVSVRTALIRLATRFLEVLLAPRTLEVHRLAVAEAHRHPQAARAFFNAAPEVSYATLATFVAAQQAAGTLRAGDPRRLAGIFLDSLTGDTQLQALLGLQSGSDKQRKALIENATDIFLEGMRSGTASPLPSPASKTAKRIK
jgi:TetR/AcrR family transcriptional repressor of mexJK operon